KSWTTRAILTGWSGPNAVVKGLRDSRFVCHDERMESDPAHQHSRIIQTRPLNWATARKQEIVTNGVNDADFQACAFYPGDRKRQKHQAIDGLPFLGELPPEGPRI